MVVNTPDSSSFRPDSVLESLPDAFQAFDREWRYVYLNRRAEEILGRSRAELLGKVCWEEYPDTLGSSYHLHHREAMENGRSVTFEEFRPREETWIEFTLHPYPGGLAAFARDITARKRAEIATQRSEHHYHEALERAEQLVQDLAEERETLDTVNRIGRLLSGELNLDRLTQAATDAATELTGAEFGAFFFNVTNTLGESYLLYTISGVPREAFSRFPMPRATEMFGPTFRGEDVIRLGDVTRDPRYGHMAPYHGMPAGHLPVRSYLALPVLSRSGEVLGGLFFGHSRPDVFTEQAERNVQALVAQLAVAMDNARLFGDAARKATLAALRADISAALAQRGSLPEVLQQCTASLVEHLQAAFAGIWTWDDRQQALALQASTGASPAEDTAARSERIARARRPDLSNGEPSFAGYPLRIEDRVIGVVALSAAEPMPADILAELSDVADTLAQGVERRLVEQRLTESEARQRTFLREVLGSVTEGRLRLCDSAADLPERLPAFGEPVTLSAQTLRVLRRRAAEAGEAAGLSQDRRNDLLTATSEAGMNAVVHAGGGIGTVGLDRGAHRVQVWVEDRGRGIDMNSLPRATLDRGYTTAGTLGHGFKLVLSTVDAVWLLTGPHGTTVVLTQERESPRPGWLPSVD